MAARARILALALSLSSTSTLVHCTSFGTSGDEPTEEDASVVRPPTDAQVVGDRGPLPPPPFLDAGDAQTSDTGPVGTADYNGVATPIELPPTPPYAYLPGATPRFFALAQTGNLAREVSLLPSPDWPVSRTASFAMVKTLSGTATNGLVTTGLKDNGDMEIAKQNTSGEGRDTGNGTAVASTPNGNVYFARTAPGNTGEVCYKVIDTTTLEISSSTKVLTNVPPIVRPFAVSEDEKVLLRNDPTSPAQVLLHRRGGTGNFGAAETKTIAPPLAATDGILGFAGASFYAYRLVGGKTIVFRYAPR